MSVSYQVAAHPNSQPKCPPSVAFPPRRLGVVFLPQPLTSPVDSHTTQCATAGNTETRATYKPPQSNPSAIAKSPGPSPPASTAHPPASTRAPSPAAHRFPSSPPHPPPQTSAENPATHQ